MMSQTQIQELRLLQKEAYALRVKPTLTKEDQVRAQLLMSEISLLKAGASLAEINQVRLREFELAHGLEPTSFEAEREPLTAEKRAEHKFWSDAILYGKLPGQKQQEMRAMGIGEPKNAIGIFSGLGFLVPATYLDPIFSTVRQYDALFDPDVVTWVSSKSGNPCQVGVYDDADQFATEAGENSDQSSNDNPLQAAGEVTLGAWSYRLPMFRISREALADVELGSGIIEIWKKVAAQRIGNIVGKRLVNGSGSGQPTGLITSLFASGVVPVVAAGSAANTGGSELGTNSVGSADFARLVGAVDPYYRGPDARFLMNQSTFDYVQSIVTKQGLPLVSFYNGAARILNYPVAICPSMDSMGATANPVVFGNTKYFAVREIRDNLTFLQVIHQAPGLVESGSVGLRVTCRYDSKLLYNGRSTTKPPLAILQNHS